MDRTAEQTSEEEWDRVMRLNVTVRSTSLALARLCLWMGDAHSPMYIRAACIGRLADEQGGSADYEEARAWVHHQQRFRLGARGRPRCRGLLHFQGCCHPHDQVRALLRSPGTMQSCTNHNNAPWTGPWRWITPTKASGSMPCVREIPSCPGGSTAIERRC